MMRRAEGATLRTGATRPGYQPHAQECECRRKRATTRLPDRPEAGRGQSEEDPGRSQAGPGQPEAAPDRPKARPGPPGGRGGGHCWRPAGGPGCRRSPNWPLPTTTRRRPPWAEAPEAATRRGCGCGRCCGRRSPPAGRWPTPKRHSPACRRGTTAGAKAVSAPSQRSGW